MYNPQLETFLRVANAGSFNKAAAEAFITPSAVIKQINLLEESLEVSLFERTHRGLNLTDAGKSIYQDAKYIIQYCKDSVARAKNTVKAGDGLIRIGTSPMTPAGGKGAAGPNGSVRAEPAFDAPQLEPLCGRAAG